MKSTTREPRFVAVSRRARGYVAECFWIGVTEDDLRLVDRRASAVDAIKRGRVRYLGSVLVCEDEVVLCFFEGAEASVRRVALAAAIPFDRILETTTSPWAAAKRERGGREAQNVGRVPMRPRSLEP